MGPGIVSEKVPLLVMATPRIAVRDSNPGSCHLRLHAKRERRFASGAKSFRILVQPGRSTVGLQPLELRIGVRIPAGLPTFSAREFPPPERQSVELLSS